MTLRLRRVALADLGPGELAAVVAAAPGEDAVRTLPINQCLITFQCEGTS